MNIKNRIYFTEIESIIPNTKHLKATLLLETFGCTDTCESSIDLDEVAKQRMLALMSDIVYGEVKREVNYLYTLVDKLKDCGEYCKAIELEDSLNSLIKLCDLTGGVLK